jgi:catalase
VRLRPESFADHYSHARLFYRSQTEPEQNHIVSALVFELSKVETPEIRARVVSHLLNIETSLAERVAKGLRLTSLPAPAPTDYPARDSLDPSPALSIIAKTKPTIEGRILACLVSDGTDEAVVNGLRAAVEAEGAQLKIVAPMVGGVKTKQGKMLPADFQLAGGPSVFFDAVVIAVSADGAELLKGESAALDFIGDAFAHLKVIGYVATAKPLLAEAGLDEAKFDDGVVAVDAKGALKGFIAQAKKHRIWDREPKVRIVP